MRSCGDCTLCCTLTFVPELNKLENVTCSHCDGGCKIYDGRPKACEDYKCAWLAGEFSDEMRPDKAHVMIEIYPQMVAALLEPGHTVSSLAPETLRSFDKFVDGGTPVIASGQFARLPRGMSAQEAKRRMVETIREVRAA